MLCLKPRQNPNAVKRPRSCWADNVYQLLCNWASAAHNTSRVVYALLIINKAGGLIYNREFHTGLTKLTSNDLLILAGTFHG
jgi:hypothetical protein